jgi:Ribbon-helix-helix protein, copG family
MASQPRMKIVSIRMSEGVWEALQDEAARCGVSASEFIREAAVFRLGYLWASRMDNDGIAQRMDELGLTLDP